jgi:hypothetical protein
MKCFGSLFLAASVASVCVISTVSCGSPSNDDVKPETTQALSDINEAVTKAGGDYNKLSAADKQKAIQMAGGSEDRAKSLVFRMSHLPPAVGTHGAPSGPPARQ